MSEEIVHYETESQQAVAVWKPVMAVAEIASRQSAIAALMHQAMKRDLHYGVIPGTGKKPTLLKAGAEMLTTFFGLSKSFTILERTEDWTGKDHDGAPFFYYLVRCHLRRGDALIAEADASCNSMESKYRWRTEWKSGQKTRVPNDDIHSQVNTILKMAQKRALVAATLLAVGASDFFTQDIEDMAADYVEGEIVSETPAPAPSPTPPQPHTNGDPLAPDALLASIRKVETLYAEQYGDAMVDTETMKRVAGALGKLVGDANRPTLLQRIANVSSTKELRRCTAVAIARWLGIEKSGYVATRPQAQAEAEALLADRPDGWEQEVTA